MNALLIGKEPPQSLGYTYILEQSADAVVIGSLTISQLLHFALEPALEALSQGKPVIVYEPGLPEAKGSRGLAATLASKRRELKSWGIIFTDGGRRRLVTAEEARQLRLSGKRPGPGAVLTPLAKEILEGMQ